MSRIGIILGFLLPVSWGVSLAASPFHFLATPKEISAPDIDWKRGTKIYEILQDLKLSNLAHVHSHAEMSGGKMALFKLWEWVQEDEKKAGTRLYQNFGDFWRKHTVFRPMSAGDHGLAYYLENKIPIFAQTIGANPKRIQEWFALQIQAAAHENVTRLALRFSPGWLTSQSGLPWGEALSAALRGMRQGLEEIESSQKTMKVQLYHIATRELSSGLDKEIKFFLANPIYSGFDIAGDEAAVPISKLKDSLAKLKNSGRPVTIHAGEIDADGVEAALTIGGAWRIGHGVTIADDPQYLLRFREKFPQVMLEVNPTSNLYVMNMQNYHNNVPALLKADVNLSFNTDDSATFLAPYVDENGVHRFMPITLAYEYAAALLPWKEGGTGLSKFDLQKIQQNGIEQFELFEPQNGAPTLNQILETGKF